MRNVAAFFSILLPGFGQIYNQQFLKGVVFVVLEHFDNMFGNVNKAIYLDFNGFHQQALEVVTYDTLLFYPGFYAYVVWDAWYYAKEGANKTITPIPFIISGFLGLLGAIFAVKLPFPFLTLGFLMLIPMIIRLFLFRKQ